MRTCSNACAVASKLDADLDVFIQGTARTVLAMEARRRRETQQWEQRLQKEQAEHEQTRMEMDNELQNERFERLQEAERYEAAKLQSSREMDATCSVLHDALRYNESQWLENVAHWTGVAAQLTEDLASAHQSHTTHVAALRAEAMRDRARRVCMQLCADVRQARAAVEKEELSVKLNRVKAANAQSEVTYMALVQKLELELARADEVNAALRAEDERKHQILGAEITRLRSLMDSALQVGLGYQFPDTARQRLYFESLKRKEVHRDEPSISHVRTLTKRGWHDEPHTLQPSASPPPSPEAPSRPPSHRAAPQSPRASPAPSPRHASMLTGQDGIMRRKYYGTASLPLRHDIAGDRDRGQCDERDRLDYQSLHMQLNHFPVSGRSNGLVG